MAGDAARVNGNLIDWGSLKFKMDGTPYSGITGIEYADGRERAYAHGIGRHRTPRGRTAGKYQPEPLVVTCWSSTAKAIRADLAAKASDKKSYGNVEVPIIVQYIEPDDAEITVEAIGCVLVKDESSDEEGPEGLNVKLTFSPMRLIRDGLSLFDQTEGGA